MEQNMVTDIITTLAQLKQAEVDGDIQKRTELYTSLVEMYADAGDTGTALGLCQKNINLLEKLNDPVALGNAYIQKGELLEDSPYMAEVCYRKALEFFITAGDKENMGITYYRLGNNVQYHQAAVEYFKKGTEIFDELRSGTGVSNGLTKQGAHLVELKKFQEAEPLLENAVEIARQIKNDELLADALYWLARSKSAQEKHFPAQKLIEEAITINSKLEDSESLAYMKYRYGVILMEQEKYQEATTAFKESEDLNRKTGDLNGIPLILQNLGIIAFKTKDYHTAMQYFTQEAFMRSYDDDKKLALAHAAYMCTLMGYTQDAVNYYTMRLRLFDGGMYTADTPVDKAEALYDLSKALLQNGEVLKSEQKCRECIKQTEQLKDHIEHYESYLNNARALLDEIQSNIPSPKEPLPKIDVPSVFTREFVSEITKNIISDKFGVDESEVIELAHITNDLGADSLDCVELIMSMEKEFNVNLADDECERINTVGDAINLIMSKLK